MLRFTLALIFAAVTAAASAQPLTTKPSFTDMLTANCAVTNLLIGGSTSPGCGPAFGSSNTASTVVQRDASGNFTAGTITATLSGTANAVNLAASGSGGVTGNLPVGNLNSGTGATSSTVWCGNGTWCTPAGGGDVVGPASAVTNNITAYNGTTGKLIKDSGIPTAALPTAVGQLPGTATNNSATAGNVGELIEASAALSSVSLTTGTPANITSISLTAGDWNVYGTIYYTPAATTTVKLIQASTNVTTATIDAAPGHFGQFTLNNTVLSSDTNIISVSPGQPKRYSLSGTTTVFLTTNQVFGISTLSGGGKIRAQRTR